MAKGEKKKVFFVFVHNVLFSCFVVVEGEFGHGGVTVLGGGISSSKFIYREGVGENAVRVLKSNVPGNRRGQDHSQNAQTYHDHNLLLQ